MCQHVRLHTLQTSSFQYKQYPCEISVHWRTGWNWLLLLMDKVSNMRRLSAPYNGIWPQLQSSFLKIQSVFGQKLRTRHNILRFGIDSSFSVHYNDLLVICTARRISGHGFLSLLILIPYLSLFCNHCVWRYYKTWWFSWSVHLPQDPQQLFSSLPVFSSFLLQQKLLPHAFYISMQWEAPYGIPDPPNRLQCLCKMMIVHLESGVDSWTLTAADQSALPYWFAVKWDQYRLLHPPQYPIDPRGIAFQGEFQKIPFLLKHPWHVPVVFTDSMLVFLEILSKKGIFLE